ncbi:MAG: chemotaxis protein CheX [Magnetococcales bacterium]|nr:chemotaxis protein CheX [Magnetococcales bacterium]
MTMQTEAVYDALQVAVVDVLNRMAMSDAVFIHRESVPRFRLDSETGGMVRLSGALNGMIGLTCHLGLVKDLVSRIGGLPSDQLEREDVMDGIAELANLFGGWTKTNAGVSDVRVSAPMAFIGQEVVAEWKTDRPTERFIFHVNDDALHVLASF